MFRPLLLETVFYSGYFDKLWLKSCTDKKDCDLGVVQPILEILLKRNKKKAVPNNLDFAPSDNWLVAERGFIFKWNTRVVFF